MAKSKALVTLIREIVRQEVKKEVNSIFIKEGVKAVAQNNGVPEVLPKPIPKKAKPTPKVEKVVKEKAEKKEKESQSKRENF